MESLEESTGDNLIDLTPHQVISKKIQYKVYFGDEIINRSMKMTVFSILRVTKFVPYILIYENNERKVKAINNLVEDFSSDIEDYFNVFIDKIKNRKDTNNDNIYCFYLFGDEVQKKDFTLVELDFTKGVVEFDFNLEDRYEEDILDDFKTRLLPLKLEEPFDSSQEIIFNLGINLGIEDEQVPFSPNAFTETIYIIPYFINRFYFHDKSKSFAYKKQKDFYYVDSEGYSHRLILDNVLHGKNYEYFSFELDDEVLNDFLEQVNPQTEAVELTTYEYDLRIKVNVNRQVDIYEFIANLVSDLYFYLKYFNSNIVNSYFVMFGKLYDDYFQYFEEKIRKETPVIESNVMQNKYFFPKRDYRTKCQKNRQPEVYFQEDKPHDEEGFVLFPTDEMLADQEIREWFENIEKPYRIRFWVRCNKEKHPEIGYQYHEERNKKKYYLPCCFCKKQERKEKKIKKRNPTVLKKISKPLKKDTYVANGKFGRNPEKMKDIESVLDGKYTLVRKGMPLSRMSFYQAVAYAVQNEYDPIEPDQIDLYELLNYTPQETFHMSFEELKDMFDDIKNERSDFDSYYFYRYLEKIFNVSIFIFTFDIDLKSGIDLEIPHNKYGHYRTYNKYTDTILIYKYKYRDGVHYEPIFHLTKKNEAKYLFTDNDQDSLLDLIHEKQKIISKDEKVITFDFDPYPKKYKVVSQVIDIYGKGRAFVVSTKEGHKLLYSKQPFQPYNEIDIIEKTIHEDEMYWSEKIDTGELYGMSLNQKTRPAFTYLDLEEITNSWKHKKNYYVSNFVLQVYKYMFHEKYGVFEKKVIYQNKTNEFVNKYFVVDPKREKIKIKIKKDNFMKARDFSQIMGVLERYTNGIVKGDKFVVKKEIELDYIEFFLRQTYRYNPNDLIVDFYLTKEEYITERSYNHHIFFNEEQFELWVKYRRSLQRQYNYQKDLTEPYEMMIDNSYYIVQKIGPYKRLAEFILETYLLTGINCYAGGEKTIDFNKEDFRNFKSLSKYNTYYHVEKKWEKKTDDESGLLKYKDEFSLLMKY